MSQTITNARDVARKYPTTALADRVLLETEGLRLERMAGPGVAGNVELGRPALSVQAILVDDGAGAFAPGGAAPAALPMPLVPTHFTLTPQNANGRGELVEAGGRNYSAAFLNVWYYADEPEGTIGGQSAVG